MSDRDALGLKTADGLGGQEPVKRRGGRPKKTDLEAHAQKLAVESSAPVTTAKPVTAKARSASKTQKAAKPATTPVKPSKPGVEALAKTKDQVTAKDPSKDQVKDPPKTEPKGKDQDPAAEAMSQFHSEHQHLIEKLSFNLAKAAMTAQGVLAEVAMRQAENPTPLDPDPFNVKPALTEVAGKLALQPDKLFKAQMDLFGRYMDLWAHTTERALTGKEPDLTKSDKRFADPQWTENPILDVVKHSYLITSDWLNSLVSSVDGVEPMTKRRVEFFTKMLTDAFSPTNFLASNPTALKAMIESEGESLVRGMEQFAEDIEKGGGRLSISQTDTSHFVVGENIATAPGKVVWKDELFELLQFSPTTETVHEIPLLIFPPWINKYYILDLQPKNSMIRWLTDQGFSVFICSWVNPGPELSQKNFADYMRDGIYRASRKVMEQCGVQKINAVGYCIGGTLLGASLAHMAATHTNLINAATFFAAQQDFSEAGDLLLFTNETWLHEIEKRMDEAGGVLPGSAMADTFNALRANDLVWSFFVNNYLLGKELPAFDLLFWNTDTTRMPKALHMFYLRQCYGKNALAKGEMELDGVRLNLKDVKIPLYFQAGREDHIAPSRSVYKSARAFGGPVTYTLAGSGHIAGVVNAPAAQKYQHWVNPALPDTLETWLGAAIEQKGSWWPHWKMWLSEQSGGQIKARDPQNGPLKALGDAPGDYVKVKS